AAYSVLDLDVGFAISETGGRGLAAGQPEKSAVRIRQRRIGGAAEDLEFIVHTGTLRLALRFLVHAQVSLLFRRRRKSCHDVHSQRSGFKNCVSGWAARIRT